jgi:hypothetical protein
MHALLSLVQMTDAFHLYTAVLPLTNRLPLHPHNALNTQFGKHFGGSVTFSYFILAEELYFSVFQDAPDQWCFAASRLRLARGVGREDCEYVSNDLM